MNRCIKEIYSNSGIDLWIKSGTYWAGSKNCLVGWKSDFNRQIFDELAKGSSLVGVMLNIGMYIRNRCGIIENR